MELRQAPARVTKRKADAQDNERLSKRLSLLNLEKNGQKLYVPVENPSVRTAQPSHPPTEPHPADEDDAMRLDNTKHKVYIYNIDDELSDSESDDGKLVFLPDIEKHLRTTRIPPSVFANSDGELAGNSQLVLYNVPSSLTVPEERDSVRKAILESRARARASNGVAAGGSRSYLPLSPIQESRAAMPGSKDREKTLPIDLSRPGSWQNTESDDMDLS